jgi:glycosyltransferase involved in cell wall biosynthesis
VALNIFNKKSKREEKPEQALICITTCNRPDWVKKLAPAYVDFWKEHEDRYQFLLAIDGKDEETIAWADENEIPYMYAEERMGVSMSKNRVIQNFWGYDYYFFVDDDVELIDGRVFDEHIEAYNKTGIHHFNLGDDKRFYYRKKLIKKAGLQLTTSYVGSGAFTFYTADSFSITGFFHPKFGEYKRYGHTEHSFRAFRNRLSPAPFVRIDSCVPYIQYNEPESVTVHDHSKMDAPFGIALVEKGIIDSEIYHISDFPDGKVTIKNVDNKPMDSFNRTEALINEFGVFGGLSLLFNKKANALRGFKRRLFGAKKTGHSYNF